MNPIPDRATESHEELERKARKRVKELKDFYVHAGIFIVINAFLVALNLLSSPETFWAIWPILGWGIGLASHAVSVFGLFGIGSQSWEEQKVKEYIVQHQKGLTAEDVKDLLHEELRPSRDPEKQRIIQRLEHLEAIVTSQEWDLIEQAGTLRDESSLDDDRRPDVEDPQNETARLARRLR